MKVELENWSTGSKIKSKSAGAPNPGVPQYYIFPISPCSTHTCLDKSGVFIQSRCGSSSSFSSAKSLVSGLVKSHSQSPLWGCEPVTFRLSAEKCALLSSYLISRWFVSQMPQQATCSWMKPWNTSKTRSLQRRCRAGSNSSAVSTALPFIDLLTHLNSE